MPNTSTVTLSGGLRDHIPLAPLSFRKGYKNGEGYYYFTCEDISADLARHARVINLACLLDEGRDEGETVWQTSLTML
jgi:hypothetical protein